MEGKACIIDDPKQTKRLLADIGKVDPLKIDSYIAAGGYESLKKSLAMEASQDH